MKWSTRVPSKHVCQVLFHYHWGTTSLSTKFVFILVSTFSKPISPSARTLFVSLTACSYGGGGSLMVVFASLVLYDTPLVPNVAGWAAVIPAIGFAAKYKFIFLIEITQTKQKVVP